MTGMAVLVLLGLAACRVGQPSEAIIAAEDAQQPSAYTSSTALPVVDIIPATSTPTPTLVPTPTVTPIAPSMIKTGQVEAEWMPYPVGYSIYFPRGYEEKPDNCYPLLILLHGQSYPETQWIDLGIQEEADALMDETQQPFLIVMPREVYYLQEMEESLYGRAVAEVLLPFLIKTYPVCEQRSQHAVGGISRGASWAIHLGFEYPQDFSIIGAHSLPPHRNDIYKLPYWVKDKLPGEDTAIYIDIGVFDRYVEPAQLFESYLVKYHVPHEFHLNDGMHEDAYWRAHIGEYLAWYAAQWGNPVSSD